MRRKADSMDDTSTIASQIAQLRRTVSEDDDDSGDQVRLSAQREHVETADMPMCAFVCGVRPQHSLG